LNNQKIKRQQMKKLPKKITKIEPPTLPPLAGTPPAHPLPSPSKRKRAATQSPVNLCASLTSANIKAVIDKIIDSRNKAVSDAAANGVTGKFASAARDNLTYLTEARDKMRVLLAWMYSAGVLGVPPAPPLFVASAGAYQIHGYARETVIFLHYARYWAMISAVYHKSADARNSYELTTQALELIESLGAQAGRCYMEPYGPFI
jgi:hypothetical protein